MEKREYLLPGLYLLLPFMILMRGHIWEGQQIGFLMIFLLLAVTIMTDRNIQQERKSNTLTWMRILLYYAIAYQIYLFIFALLHLQAFQFAISAGYSQLLFMIGGLTVFTAASRSNLKTEIWADVICLAALIQTGIALLQVYGGIDLIDIAYVATGMSASKPSSSPVGMLGNQNFLAALLAYSVPFFFRRYWILILPFLILTLIISMTSSAVGPAIIGCGIFVAMKYRIGWKRLFPACIGLVALAAGYVLWYDPIVGNDRFEMWCQAIRQTSDNWIYVLFGFGPGAAWAYKHPMHSEWVTLYQQFGLIGIGSAVGFIASLPRRNPYLVSSFCIGLMNMAGNSALHYPITAFLLCLVGGLLVRERT